MKKVILLLFSVCGILSCTHTPKWELVWEDNFNGTEPDTAIWSRIPRGKPDWQNTQSFDDRCYEMRDGLLILKGIVNDDTKADTAKYSDRRIVDKGKACFPWRTYRKYAPNYTGKRGMAAIWTLPYETDKYSWPIGGEVDIMERLNHDSVVYQTVHSHYTYTLGIENNPKHGNTISINPEEFNVYGVDFWPDSLVFHVNGKRNFVYPRIETEQEGQFPFNIPQYLLIDMQLGGTWVGTVDSAELP